jgi:hypothetical protein
VPQPITLTFRNRYFPHRLYLCIFAWFSGSSWSSRTESVLFWRISCFRELGYWIESSAVRPHLWFTRLWQPADGARRSARLGVDVLPLLPNTITLSLHAERVGPQPPRKAECAHLVLVYVCVSTCTEGTKSMDSFHSSRVQKGINKPIPLPSSLQNSIESAVGPVFRFSSRGCVVGGRTARHLFLSSIIEESNTSFVNRKFPDKIPLCLSLTSQNYHFKGSHCRRAYCTWSFPVFSLRMYLRLFLHSCN